MKFFFGEGLKQNKTNKQKSKGSYDFHSMKPPSAPGARERQRELSTYRRMGVHHSQETRGTQDRHKAEKKEESRERKRFNSQDTKHTTKREAVNTTTTTTTTITTTTITIMIRNDTLVLNTSN